MRATLGTKMFLTVTAVVGIFIALLLVPVVADFATKARVTDWINKLNNLGYLVVEASGAGYILGGTLIPEGDAIYDLGSSSKTWRRLYLGDSLHLRNNKAVVARNAADTADVPMWKLNTSDQVEAGADVVLPAGTSLTVSDGIDKSSLKSNALEVLANYGKTFGLVNWNADAATTTVSGSGMVTLDGTDLVLKVTDAAVGSALAVTDQGFKGYSSTWHGRLSLVKSGSFTYTSGWVVFKSDDLNTVGIRIAAGGSWYYSCQSAGSYEEYGMTTPSSWTVVDIVASAGDIKFYNGGTLVATCSTQVPPLNAPKVEAKMESTTAEFNKISIHGVAYESY